MFDSVSRILRFGMVPPLFMRKFIPRGFILLLGALHV